MEEKRKKIIQIVAFGLVALIVLSLIIAMALMTAMPKSTKQAGDMGGMSVGSVEERGIAVQTVQIDLQDLDAEERERRGISRLAETAYTLTATVNATATEKVVSWTVAFKDPSSEWATGKTATDYVTAVSTGDLTATVSCLQPFGEQIIVSAVSKDDPQVKADCTCEYRKRLVAANIHLTSDTAEHSITQDGAVQNANLGKIYFGDSYTIGATPVFTDGTIDAAARVYWYQATFSVPQEAAAELAKNGFTRQGSGNDVTVGFASPTKAFDDQVLFAFFGPGVVETPTALLNAVRALKGTYNNLIRVTVEFIFDGGGDYDGPKGFDFYLDIDADSIYNPVTSVQVDQEELIF